MNYDDGSGSGIRRLSENERFRLLREEEQALGIWEYHVDPNSNLPTVPAAPASALNTYSPPPAAALDADRKQSQAAEVSQRELHELVATGALA